MIWVIYKPNGEIVGAAADADWAQAAAGDKLHVLEHHEEINIREYTVQDGALARKSDATIEDEAEAARLSEAWRQLRFRRSQLLAKTDWTQFADSPADAAAWAVYRQALRDLPETTTNPFNPNWPEIPA